MKEVRRRALTHCLFSAQNVITILVELKEARYRALTHLRFHLFHSSSLQVEMKVARNRALTQDKLLELSISRSLFVL